MEFLRRWATAKLWHLPCLYALLYLILSLYAYTVHFNLLEQRFSEQIVFRRSTVFTGSWLILQDLAMD